MLSGGAGQFYGNHYTWSFPPGWDSHIDTVGVSQLTIWKDFFSSLAWAGFSSRPNAHRTYGGVWDIWRQQNRIRLQNTRDQDAPASERKRLCNRRENDRWIDCCCLFANRASDHG